VDEAKDTLIEMTRKTPDYLTAWRLLAQISATEKKYDQALTLLDNVFTRDASNLEARLLQSEILLTKGEAGKAIEGLERLRSSWPRSPVVMYQLGRAYLRDGNVGQAGSVLDDAVAASPDYVDAVLLRAEVALRTGGEKTVVASMLDVLKKRPGFPEAEFLLARAYRLLGRPEDAAAIFRGQVTADPKNGGAHLRLGAIMREAGRMPEARASLEKAQELEPGNLLITYQLVEADIAANDFDGAHRRVGVLLQRMPDSAGAHFLEGKIFAAQRNWDRAEAELQKAIELDAAIPLGYDTLIETYVAAGKLPEAVRRLEESLVKKPGDARALLTVAMLYEKMDAVPKARETYEKLLALKPDFVPMLNNLAIFYAERIQDLDKAHETARKARTLDANDPAIADTLGWILYKRADYQQALALLVEAAGKAPENLEIQFHLGMANYMMGQTDAARTALQRAAKATANFPGKDEAARRLAELEALVKQQPDDILARVRLGEAYEKQGAFPKAAAAYDEAIKRNPKLLSATAKLAQMYAGPLKDGAKALELAKKARALAPNDPATGELLGRVSFQTGNYTAAYSMLQESARQPNAGAAVLYDFARAAYATGRVRQAQETLKRVVNAGAGSPEADDAKSFLAMSELEENPKDLAASEPEMQKLLAANPAHLPALMVRAALQVQRGDTKGAAAAYTEILGRFADFAPAQKRLASLYAADPATRDKAYEFATKAFKSLPDDPEIAQTLAELSYHRKQYTSTIQLYKQSAGKRPLNAKALFFLGMAHVRQKELPQGRDALTRAIESGLEEPLAAEAKRALEEMKDK
jgi:tetratricopeptide (TPR) repeat protein